MTEHYEIRVEGGVQFLYFKGEKLPYQTLSIVKQDCDMLAPEKAFCEVTIKLNAILANSEVK